MYQAEVLGMLLTEYNEAETMKLFQRDSYNQGKEDGFKLGKEDGKLYMLVSLVKQHLLSLADAARQLNISEADFQKLMSEHQS